MKHADYVAYLSSIFAQWPAMRRYSNTAQSERVWLSIEQIHYDMITVTLFDRRIEPDERNDERNGALSYDEALTIRLAPLQGLRHVVPGQAS